MAPLALNTTRRNELPDQIVDGNDPAKIFLLVHDNGKTKPSSAQLLHNAVGGLLFRRGCNTPDIIAQWPISVFVEQDVEDVDESSRLLFRSKHRQTIETGSSAELQCLLCRRAR